MSLRGAISRHGNPAGWEAAALRSLLVQVDNVGSPDQPLLGVSVAEGVRPRYEGDGRPAPSEDLSSYKQVDKGDIVMNRLGKPHGSVGMSTLQGITSPAYWVLRVNPEMAYPRFMHHLLRSQHMIREYERLGKYMPPNQFDISWDAFRSIRVPLPPLGGQRRIADFLDSESARVEEVLNLLRSLAETIEERFVARLDELLGGIDALTPLKHLVRFREGPGIMASEFRDEGVPLIRISGLVNGEVTLRGANHLDAEMVESRWSQFKLGLGDYVISGSATMGGVSVVRDVEVIGAIPYTGLIILRPKLKDVSMEFISATLRSSQFLRQIDMLKAGAMMQHFGPTHLSRTSVPFPSLARQQQVVGAVRTLDFESRGLLDSIARQRALLAERRQALITAAVTGHIDVTTARGISA